MHRVERLAHSNRWSGRHAGEKCALGGGLLALSLVLPPLPGAIFVLLAAVGAALGAARLPPGGYASILALPAGFLCMGTLTLAVSLDPFGAGPWLTVTAAGVAIALEAGLRALAATASLLLIVLTTPVHEVLGLLRRARLPAPICDIMLLIYRMAILTLDIAAAARRAQAGRLGYTGLARSVRSAGLLLANLLPRLLGRAERMQAGLAARAYDGELRVLPPPRGPSRAFLGASVLLLCAVAVASYAADVAIGPAAAGGTW
jgi:cobalt/nickel transport system permease protein